MSEPKIPKIKIPQDFKVFAKAIDIITDRINKQDVVQISLGITMPVALPGLGEPTPSIMPLQSPSVPGTFIINCEFEALSGLEIVERQSFAQNLITKLKPDLEKFGIVKLFIYKR